MGVCRLSLKWIEMREVGPLSKFHGGGGRGLILRVIWKNEGKKRGGFT